MTSIFYVHNQKFSAVFCFANWDLFAEVSGASVKIGTCRTFDDCIERAKSWMGYYL